MSCPKCGTANEDDARFCIQCGTGLDAARESAAGARSGMRERPGAAASSRLKLSIVLLSGVILVVALALAAWLSLGGGAGVLGLAGRNGSPAEGKSQAAAQPGRTPTMPLGSDIFANPSQPAYVPGKGFAPDAQRIIDLASVRLSLERYRQSKGTYPAALADLFPAFAARAGGKDLSGPPLDPVTGRAYEYRVKQAGQGYELTALLDSGKPYTMTEEGR